MTRCKTTSVFFLFLRLHNLGNQVVLFVRSSRPIRFKSKLKSNLVVVEDWKLDLELDETHIALIPLEYEVYLSLSTSTFIIHHRHRYRRPQQQQHHDVFLLTQHDQFIAAFFFFGTVDGTKCFRSPPSRGHSRSLFSPDHHTHRTASPAAAEDLFLGIREGRVPSAPTHMVNTCRSGRELWTSDESTFTWKAVPQKASFSHTS